MPARQKMDGMILPEIIAIIPARGGSKGLPRKNIIDLAGKPLIAYSILSALTSHHIDRVIVSTEDQEIADVSRAWGAEVPFLRSSALAQDNSNLGQAITDAVQQLGGMTPERIFVTLCPTSPLRPAGFIDHCLDILLTGYQSLITVKPILTDPDLVFGTGKGGLTNISPPWPKRQYYRPYGTLYACAGTGRGHCFLPIKDTCTLVDIDTQQDLDIAATLLNNAAFDLGY